MPTVHVELHTLWHQRGHMTRRCYVRGTDGLVHTGHLIPHYTTPYYVVECTFSAVCDIIKPRPVTCLRCVPHITERS